MKNGLILLLFVVVSALFYGGPFPARHSMISPGEYIPSGYDSVTDQWYYSFSSIIPAPWTNQPVHSDFGGGGPHDAYIDSAGILRLSGANNVGQDAIGSTTATCTGCMVTVTTDINSNPLPPMAGVFMTLNPTNGENWFTLAYSTIASGGLVYETGCTQDGMSGDGTTGSAAQTKFKQVTMPHNDTIVKVEGFQMVLALSNHDSVLSWGANNYNYALGQGNTPVSNAPGYVHLPTGWHAYDIGGGGIMSYILADSAVTHYKIFSWGWQFDPGYQGLGASGTVHTTPTDVTSNAFMSPMTGHTHAVSVTCNTESCYFKGADGTGWDIGGNAVGTIGNGQSLNFAIYTTNPAPYGGTNSFPYAWDESQGELMQDTIYNFLPGVTDIDTIYTGHSNSWYVYVLENNSHLWSWGRNKSSAIWANQVDSNNGKSIMIIDANYSNGNIASSYPDSWTMPWPNRIIYPNATGYEISQTSSPYCVTHGSSSPCNIYTIPTTGAPLINPGPNQTISTSFTTLAGNAAGQGGSIINANTWSQKSGPNNAIITAPGYQNTQISGLIVGTYTFQDSVTDNNWRTNKATMTVTVTNSCNCLILPCNCKIASNNIKYEKDFDLRRPFATIFGKCPDDTLSINPMYRHPHTSG